jgi:hypothetical protein
MESRCRVIRSIVAALRSGNGLVGIRRAGFLTRLMAGRGRVLLFEHDSCWVWSIWRRREGEKLISTGSRDEIVTGKLPECPLLVRNSIGCRAIYLGREEGVWVHMWLPKHSTNLACYPRRDTS